MPGVGSSRWKTTHYTTLTPLPMATEMTSLILLYIDENTIFASSVQSSSSELLSLAAKNNYQ